MPTTSRAFDKTALVGGGFEFFFAAPSLEIRAPGDLDLGGLSFIEGISGGFRVGASFDLDWLGAEQAALATPASTWSGINTAPRSLSIIAGGSLDLGSARLALQGGTIVLTAQTMTIGNGSVIEVGAGGTAIGSLPGGGDRILTPPYGGITLSGPSPIPEPGVPLLLFAGLGLLGARRRLGPRPGS